MTATALQKLPNSEFQLTLTVPWADIKAAYDQVFEELAGEIEIEGFRKGKAPKEMVAAKINKSSVYDEAINKVLPKAYSQALEEHHLKPIINPKVEIVSGEEEKDWQFIAKAAEKPEINLNDYKKEIGSINAKGKIWTPADGTEKPTEANAEEEKNKKVNAVVEKLLEVSTVALPEILVESEVSRILARLIDDVRQAGITYEQYLASKGTTAEKIREQYRQEVIMSLKLELVLEAVADDLGITVDEAEVKAIIDKEQDPKKKAALQAQNYYLTMVLRREKTLTRLTSL